MQFGGSEPQRSRRGSGSQHRDAPVLRTARADTGAASVSDVAFYDGPPVQLTESPYNDTKHYGVVLTSPNALRYGGPGAC